ncbi:succinylglutamate desuccinylase/aspartoacylase family protein [Pseudomonas putida]|uniref:succinylglutamate desuccinylase/aspartoacylase family protein n=1 Tax=Pseudomonas putida TaxID=303 RepID=UPI000F7758E5|nr:succinylglutamate desuccinylase/aspartoacylase family protein [Pseudomonas putida]RSC27752.1 succinylglutamate desuccinylase/aspartoacylase family protein [Pseudomonas putida]
MKRIAHPLLTATHGTQREIVSEHFGPDVYTRKVYIQACLHADETPAMLVATDLRQRLLALEAAGLLTAQIVLVPVANPAGLAQFVMGAPSGRFELASGRNYNRDFPFPLEAILQRVEGELTDDAQHNLKAVRAAWQQSLEAITPRDEMASLQRRLMLLAHDADLVLDLHCSREAVMHLYTSEWSWEQVEPLARYIGAKASLLSVDSQALSFDEALSLIWWRLRERLQGAYPIPLGNACVTVEHRGQRDVDSALAQQDAGAIIEYLCHAGFISGEPAALPELLWPGTPLAGSEQFIAPVGGVLVHRVALGAQVQPGEPMFDLIDPLSGEVTTVRSATAGVLYMRRDVRFVRPGDPLGRVTGTTPIRTGKLLSA